MSGGQAALAPQASVSDYWRLTKPKVVSLVVFTAVAGMAFALAMTGTSVGTYELLGSTLGIALSAFGAAAANCLLERRVDARMYRTMGRATAAGRISTMPAAIFSAVLLTAGLAILQASSNTLTTLLTLATFIGYAFIYTVLLKPATPQNIVIGGASGSMPPVLGWTAVTGTLDYQPLLLFLIIFVWTPPHFWSLAICKMDEYRNAKIPMLPVTHGERFTRLQIFLYAVALAAVSMLPFAAGMSGWIYSLIAMLANARFVWLSLRVLQSDSLVPARALFNFSGIYLLVVFGALMADAMAQRLA